ncbi:centrosome-associated zinc finger protein CP190 [Anticarsia gemmatalis]|uniref:centrosome-associated zinc finger protein CP190 n=1 Tax=Anticarsia gemmatalis TaxID=129554 RepID=UPI003F772A6A
MSDVKQVKVDNWGIYFLQRLKHFFNRTDYCDLTLQFQDNAQLKVHRLVLSACTEYFELLERTCEMYEDCLVMPDDLQADVVVPIVNFMYTGHLEFRMDLLERLYQTSQILNMPVLTKLLESHRVALKTPSHMYSSGKRFMKINEPAKTVKPATSTKRSYGKAFDNNSSSFREKKVYQSTPSKPEVINSPSAYRPPSPIPSETSFSSSTSRKFAGDPRPTRYELPEELDNDNVFDNSFCNISYTCKPLMVHPENVKRYSSKRSGIFSEASSSKKVLSNMSTVDIVECKKISKDDNIFDDSVPDHNMSDDLDLFQGSFNNEPAKDTSQLFDQILDDGPKVTIETKDSKAASNLDHAKIISEVLKKYPHLVKSSKNIKLKILNTPGKGNKKQPKTSPTYIEDKPKLKEEPDYTYETDVIDSQQAARLIAMGAENTKGPWICLICGTPGKALHFTSYYKFRRHLVEVHNEKPVSNICEYCGLRSLKRNYLLHHLYSQHGVPPPPQYHFPKCNRCNYIALTEGLLVKHKMTHKDAKTFCCNVCSAPFNTTKQLLKHIQATGHKYSAERKANLQCIYCLKAFLRDCNLYAHLKTYHKKEAKSDGIIEDSDDDDKPVERPSRQKVDNMDKKYHHIKFEPSTSFDNDYPKIDVQFQIQQRHDGDIQVTPRKQMNVISNLKQKILNPGFGASKSPQKAKQVRKPQPERSDFLDIHIPSPPNTSNHNDDEIVLIDNNEYIMRDNQLIPRKRNRSASSEYIISETMDSASLQAIQPTTSMEYTNEHNNSIMEESHTSMVVKKTNINQPIQIVVSNEEEYKALMSSNHPILFGHGDSNKTLTVLTTTQNNSTLGSTTIDLDAAQSNDMMIIQDDYPLNVTESVSTDNSNIVVVYSHPVDDPNKQFQILTTEGIGTQFVQSSAIITQNYETVTTSAPIMSANALEPQGTTVWHHDIPTENCQPQPLDPVPESQLQNIVENEIVKEPEIQAGDDLCELPEVHLAQEQQESVEPQETQVIDTPNELHDANIEHITQTVEQEIVEEPSSHNLPESHMETDVLPENIMDQETMAEQEPINVAAEPMEISHENENITEVLPNDIGAEPAIPEVISEPLQPENIVEQTATENVPQDEQVVEAIPAIPASENPEITESVDLADTLLAEQQLPESQAYDDIVEVNHNAKEDPPVYPKEAEEKIQTLTSEWSEDEYDVPEDTHVAQDTSVTQNTHVAQDTSMIQNTQVAQDMPAIVETTTKAAEVVSEGKQLDGTEDNIQQEVQNHVDSTDMITEDMEPLPPVQPEDNEHLLTDDSIPSLEEEPKLLPVSQSSVAPLQIEPQAQEQISSLLNDWEDNDSQEDNINNTDDAIIDDNKEEGEGKINNEPEKIPSTDNIKSLVSDWDEEDEETKE